MKTNCELPFSMFKYNIQLNDIDFVLFHLYKTNPDYRKYYNEIRISNPDRIMILDNSAYEFYIKGETLDLSEFHDAIEKLNPTYYILPDVLMDKNKTLTYVKNFLKSYSVNCDSKPLAVAQGIVEDELLECLKEYKKMGLKNICIPFHNKFFCDDGYKENRNINSLKELFLSKYDHLTVDIRYAIGRVDFVQRNKELLKSFDYVHFLGSHCPFEKVFYGNFNSMDTGYPVKLGYCGQILGYEHEKPNIIIDDFFYENIAPEVETIIIENILIFKRY